MESQNGVDGLKRIGIDFESMRAYNKRCDEAISDHDLVGSFPMTPKRWLCFS